MIYYPNIVTFALETRRWNPPWMKEGGLNNISKEGDQQRIWTNGNHGLLSMPMDRLLVRKRVPSLLLYFPSF